MPLTRDSNFLCAQVAKVGGISKVLVAENAAYEGLLAERLTPLLLAAQAQFKFSHILAGSSAFSRSVLPRYRYQLQYLLWRAENPGRLPREICQSAK